MRPADLHRHLLEVELEIDEPGARQRLSMPAWIPGSYLLRDYARHIVEIGAASEGRRIALQQEDQSTWSVESGGRPVTVRAVIYALDLSVRGNYVDARRAYFNGAAVFLMPEGHEAAPIEVSIEPPVEAGTERWRVATAMSPAAIDERGFGRYQAADYDELIDHPVEISDHARVVFMAAGVPHRVVIAGRIDADLERVAADLRVLCEQQIEFFGRPAPFGGYLFMGVAVGNGYGGLEHRASSSLIFNRDDLPKPGETGTPREYRRFLALASHEYFHSWHIKRTKPAAFEPYRLDRRNFTRQLWVFEGITSYYQERMLLLAGLVDREAYLQRVGEQLTRVYRTPGRFRQSLSDSSFNAWDVLYKPESNSPNASMSYYTKGALVALALDLELRSGSPPSSLDVVVKELWQRFGAQGIAVPEDGFESLAIELGGARLEGFFERAVRGTEDLPLAELLARFGVGLSLRRSNGPEDTGGTPQRIDAPELSLGAPFRPHASGIELVAVLDGGAAQAAGLNPGDVLVALDGLVINAGNLGKRLGRLRAGRTVSAAVIRGDELLELPFVTQASPEDTCHLEPMSDVDLEARERRAAWLGG